VQEMLSLSVDHVNFDSKTCHLDLKSISQVRFELLAIVNKTQFNPIYA
jgi:hypothetical protein